MQPSALPGGRLLPDRRDVPRAAVLACVIAAIGACAFARRSLAAWRAPLFYAGDAWAFMAEIKAAQDGHIKPFRTIRIPELNAPFEGEWNDFPSRQPTFAWLGGLLARWLGLFPA